MLSLAVVQLHVARLRTECIQIVFDTRYPQSLMCLLEGCRVIKFNFGKKMLEVLSHLIYKQRLTILVRMP